MNMIGMGMRIDCRIEMRGARHEHLLPEIRSGVDGHAGNGSGVGDAFREGRRSRAAVFRIGRIAVAPVAGNARRAG